MDASEIYSKRLHAKEVIFPKENGGESGGLSSPTTYQDDSTLDDAEAKNDFWSMSGNFIYRHHVEPRVKLCSPREESFPIPLRYIDVSRTTQTNLDGMQESGIDDYWNIDGSRDLSVSWTGFTHFTLLEEKPPDGNIWSGGRLTKRQATSRPDHLWPELWIKLGRSAKLREKQNGQLKNQSSMPEDHEESISDKEFKDHQECSQESGNASGSHCALQDK